MDPESNTGKPPDKRVEETRRQEGKSEDTPSDTESLTSSTNKGPSTPTNSAYVASVSDNLITNAQQTSQASECAKYLKELRDILIESDLDGETYEDVLESLDTLIVRVDTDGLTDTLGETRVRQIEDVAHRIERMCQRQQANRQVVDDTSDRGETTETVQRQVDNVSERAIEEVEAVFSDLEVERVVDIQYGMWIHVTLLCKSTSNSNNETTCKVKIKERGFYSIRKHLPVNEYTIAAVEKVEEN